MKLPEKTKSKKDKIKKKPISKEKNAQVLVVAQEIKFARLLSGNEKKTRDRVLKTLKKWLQNCFDKKYEFKENDFIRIWKGLFYAVWMSDKPLVQEELCEDIAAILDEFPPEHLHHALMMSKAGFHTLAKEWYGIDHHRMDKFLMLVRRYLRGSLRCISRAGWALDACAHFADMLAGPDGILAPETPLYARNATSMILHFLDCYLEEISKVSSGNIPESSLFSLLSPLCSLLVRGPGLLAAAARRCLSNLIKQSDVGIEYEERRRAWESMGCPEGGPDVLEPVEGDEEDSDGEYSNGEDDSELDPRAGRVSVSLAALPVPARRLAARLARLLRAGTRAAQARARGTARRFAQLAERQYPYKVPTIPEGAGCPSSSSREEADRAATNLRRLEKTLVASSDELALRGLRRKHRKRLLARARSGASIVDELTTADTHAQSGEWQIESIEPPAKKAKQTDKKKTKNDKKQQRKKHTDKQTIQNDKQTVQNNKAVVKNDKPVVQNDKPVLQNGVKSINSKDNVVKQKKNNKKQLANNKSSSLKENNKREQTNVDIKVKVNGDTKSVVTKNKTKLKANSNIDDTAKKPIQVQKTAVETPKKVKFVLKNNSMQGAMDYYKSVRQSPNIPYDGSKQPTKTNLKICTPSPINPFFKKMKGKKQRGSGVKLLL